ncbi:MAG: DoxX family protein [Acidobacteriota bacterium]|nr:DoxX family protein [Acidobacteriota bacterium]
MSSSSSNFRNAIIFLRFAVAAIILIHGVARIHLGMVDDLGSFLASKGFPFGFYLAWGITLFEIVGSLAMAAGFFVAPIALLFMIELAIGIYMVHWIVGWFVVGAGRNGMEYSVLLICILGAIAYTHLGKIRRK